CPFADNSIESPVAQAKWRAWLRLARSCYLLWRSKLQQREGSIDEGKRSDEGHVGLETGAAAAARQRRGDLRRGLSVRVRAARLSAGRRLRARSRARASRAGGAAT